MQKVGNMKPPILTYIQTRSHINKSTSNKNKENTGRPRKKYKGLGSNCVHFSSYKLLKSKFTFETCQKSSKNRVSS